MAATLPTDIITTILTKLPPKSLARFSCVSKTWRSLINDPNFITLHLTQSLSSNNRLIILNYGTHLESTPLSLVGPHFEGKVASRFDVPACYSGYVFRMIESCNGLVGLGCTNVDDPCLMELVLWNPSTNSHFVLPRAEHHVLDDDDVGDDDDGGGGVDDDDNVDRDFMGISFGFGYDVCNDDYKVVRIVDKFHHMMSASDDDGGGGGGGGGDEDSADDGGEGDDDDDDDEVENEGGDDHRCRFGFIYREVQVYSMKENSWKTIHVAFTGDKMEWRCPGAVIDKHLVHWLFWKYLKKAPRLSCFDLSSSKWATLGLPNFREHDHTHCLSDESDDDDDDGGGSISNGGFESSGFVVLGVLDECLCLVTRICPEFDSTYVWVMKEYGVKESWTKLFNVVEAGIVGPLRSAPLACSERGDEVLVRRENEDGRLCCYDVREKTVKGAPNIPASSLKVRDVNICVESLVRVGKMIGERDRTDKGSWMDELLISLD